MYSCMYVMYVPGMCVCTYVCIYVPGMYICMYVCMYICMYVCYVCNWYGCMYVCMSCLPVCLPACLAVSPPDALIYPVVYLVFFCPTVQGSSCRFEIIIFRKCPNSKGLSQRRSFDIWTFSWWLNLPYAVLTIDSYCCCRWSSSATTLLLILLPLLLLVLLSVCYE